MGWTSGQRYYGLIDCEGDPQECISENLFREMADIMVAEGYKDAGYEFLNMDDFWQEEIRDENNKLQANKIRFPNGIKHLADYVHGKGLKFGIYEGIGQYTCGGNPGGFYHLELDAQTFAEWGVDFVNMDGCSVEHANISTGYTAFGQYLNATGRPMVYSCSWPYFQKAIEIEPDYEIIKTHCNLWRSFNLIDDSWGSVTRITNNFAINYERIAPHGPGHWNDPDTLVIGNFGLTLDQSKQQMALWAVLAAPLIISVDLRTIRPAYKAILLNKKIIKVNQDPLGIQGKFETSTSGINIWTRPITPVVNGYHSFAIAFVSQRSSGGPYPVTVTLEELGLLNPGGYLLQDLYEPELNNETTVLPTSSLKVRVNPSGVVFYKAKAQKLKVQ